MASPQFINMLSLGDIYFTDGKGKFRFQWSTSALFDNNLINPNPDLFREDDGDLDNDYYILKTRYDQVSAHRNDGSNNAASFVCRVYDKATNEVVREVAVNGTSVEIDLPEGEYLWDVTALNKQGNVITRSSKNYICTSPAAWDKDSSKIEIESSSPFHLINEVGRYATEIKETDGYGNESTYYSWDRGLAGRIINIKDSTESKFITSGPYCGSEKRCWEAAKADGYTYSISNADGEIEGNYCICGDLLLTDAGVYVYENGQWNYKFFVQPWIWGSEAFDEENVLFCDGGGIYGKTIFCWNSKTRTLEELATAKKQVLMISGKYHVTEDGVFSNTTGKKILAYKIAEGEHSIYNDLFINSYLKNGSGKKCDRIKAGQQYSIEVKIVLFNADGSIRKNETIQLDAGTAPYDLDSEELFGERIGNCITFALSQETNCLGGPLNDPNLTNKAFVVAVGQDGSFTVRSQVITNRPYFYVDNNGALVCKYERQDPQTGERSSFTNVMYDQVDFTSLSGSTDPVVDPIVPGVDAGVDVDGNVYTFHGDNQSGAISSALAVSGKYVLNGKFGDMTGSVTLFNGGKKVATGTIKNGVLTFNNKKSVLLDSAAGISLQVTAKKGSNMEFSAVLSPESETSLFNQTDTVGNTFKTATDLGSFTKAGLVAQEWVGFGDDSDFYAFSLDTAAKLSLELSAKDAAKFTIYDSNGKSVQSTSVKANGSQTTKAKLLNPGNYYLSVQSTNASKGGAASYSVKVGTGTEFFTNIFTSPLAVNYEQKAGKTDVTFNWNAPANTGSRKITYYVSIDGGKGSKVSKTTFTAKKLSMTSHTARIYAQDNYGNTSEVTEVNFSIADTTAPKVSGLSASVCEDTVDVKFKASDNIGVTGFIVTIDNIDNYFSAEEYNNFGKLSFGDLDKGQHTVSVRAMDAAGNLSAAATKQFTVKYEKQTTYIVKGSASVIFDDMPIVTLEGSASAQNKKYFTFTSQNNPEFLHFWVNDETKLSSAVQMGVYRQSGTDAQGSYADKIDHETFPASGKKREYTLVAEPNRTYFIEISAGSPVDYAINGSVSELKLDRSSFDTAEELQAVFSPYIDFGGCLASINRQDYYRFTLVGTANIQLTAGSFAKTNWELYDSGRNLLRSELVNSSTDFNIDLQAGDYYLKVALPSSWKYDIDDAVCTYSGFITVS